MSDVRDLPDDIAEAVLHKKLAALLISNPSMRISQICKETGLSRYEVNKVLKNDAFQDLLQDTGGKELMSVVDKAKAKLSRLVDKAIAVVEKRLDKDDLEAAKMVFKATGIEKSEEKPVDTSINLILPGASNEHSIPASFSHLDEGSEIKTK